jgi:FMN phosphatase YigB (HAD superfamily)
MVGDSLVSDIRSAQAVGLGTIWLAPLGIAVFEVLSDLTIYTFAELSGRL